MDEQTLTELRKACNNALSAVKRVPSSSDTLYDYYRTFDIFNQIREEKATELFEILLKLLKRYESNVLLTMSPTDPLEVNTKKLMDLNQWVTNKYLRILDTLDKPKSFGTTPSLIVVNTQLNREADRSAKLWITGDEKEEQASVDNARKKNFESSKTVSLLTSSNVPRPQNMFRIKPDNSYGHFVPLIREKSNSLVPLDKAILDCHDLPEESGKGKVFFGHPYQFELEQFKPTKEQMLSFLDSCSIESQVFISLKECPVEMVSTKEELQRMIQKFQDENVQEIAVDLEHHSHRSYLGITCLMQLTTRNRVDYVLDALALREHLHQLNIFFTHPGVVKVMHGAEQDVLWLQRDFGLYLVNLFDTYHASHVLNMPRHSLKSLLQHYCNYEANKKYQLADWRIRPLPDELIEYARSDTHFLLYVYDRMRHDIRELDKLEDIWDMGRQLCLKRYEKPFLNIGHFMQSINYQQIATVLKPRQFHCLYELFKWRDGIARLEDESSRYVMPNHILKNIADIQPKEPERILACCNPVPPLVAKYLHEIFAIVQQARNLPEEKLHTTDELTQSRMAVGEATHSDISAAAASCMHSGTDYSEEDLLDFSHFDRDENGDPILRIKCRFTAYSTCDKLLPKPVTTSVKVNGLNYGLTSAYGLRDRELRTSSLIAHYSKLPNYVHSSAEDTVPLILNWIEKASDNIRFNQFRKPSDSKVNVLTESPRSYEPEPVPHHLESCTESSTEYLPLPDTSIIGDASDGNGTTFGQEIDYSLRSKRKKTGLEKECSEESGEPIKPKKPKTICIKLSQPHSPRTVPGAVEKLGVHKEVFGTHSKKRRKRKNANQEAMQRLFSSAEATEEPLNKTARPSHSPPLAARVKLQKRQNSTRSELS